MPAAVRPYVTAGVALLGASVISVAPIAPPQSEARTLNWDVSLVSAATIDCGMGDTSAVCNAATARAEFQDALGDLGLTAADTPATPNPLFNIAANLFIAAANVPYNLFNALGAGDVELGEFSFQPGYENVSFQQTGVVGLAEHFNFAGSWWVYSPTNVLGSDAGDIVRYQALANVLLPFPALSVPLGNMVAAIVASQLPMNAGCTGTGPGTCPDVFGILSQMFDLRHIGAMFSPGGYTFPDVKNPITCDEYGRCDILDPDGETMPWSGESVRLDPFAPFTAFVNSLTATPDFSKIRLPSLEMVVSSVVSVFAGLNTAYNPFVLGTQCGLCAPFIPNPDDRPIPGPFFPPHDATTTIEFFAPPNETTTIDPTGGEEQQVEEQDNDGNSNLSQEHETSVNRTSTEKQTVLSNPDQKLATTAIDSTDTVDNSDATTSTSTNVTTPKPGHTDGRQSVNETVSNDADDSPGGSTTDDSTTGGSAAGGSAAGGSITGGSTTAGTRTSGKTTGSSTTGGLTTDDTRTSGSTTAGAPTGGSTAVTKDGDTKKGDEGKEGGSANSDK